MVERDALRVQQDDREYQQLLRDEAAFWDRRAITLASLPPRASIRAYMNRRLTGDEQRDWYETIPQHGDFGNACVLGAEPGHIESFLLERLPNVHLSFYDISGESLARLHERLQRDHPGRSSVHQVDVNFIELPEHAHDLVIANECVHHLMNLEHVASQINRTLTSDGRFFMFEVVSESYFQFAEEKKRLFETFAVATHDDPADPPAPRWPDRSSWKDFSPFECARSGEILDVFGERLELLDLRTLGAMLTLTLFWPPETDVFRGWGKPKPPLRRAAEALGIGRRSASDAERQAARDTLLFALDELVEDTRAMRPGLAFAVYKKR
jgi:SAM-dependent methyltransferase